MPIRRRTFLNQVWNEVTEHNELRETLINPQASSKLAAREPLTRLEILILRHVGLGLSNREIAASLDIAIETVNERVSIVLRKLPAKDRTEAAGIAVKAGLVS